MMWFVIGSVFGALCSFCGMVIGFVMAKVGEGSKTP